MSWTIARWHSYYWCHMRNKTYFIYRCSLKSSFFTVFCLSQARMCWCVEGCQIERTTQYEVYAFAQGHIGSAQEELLLLLRQPSSPQAKFLQSELLQCKYALLEKNNFNCKLKYAQTMKAFIRVLCVDVCNYIYIFNTSVPVGITSWNKG